MIHSRFRLLGLALVLIILGAAAADYLFPSTKWRITGPFATPEPSSLTAVYRLPDGNIAVKVSGFGSYFVQEYDEGTDQWTKLSLDVSDIQKIDEVAFLHGVKRISWLTLPNGKTFSWGTSECISDHIGLSMLYDPACAIGQSAILLPSGKVFISGGYPQNQIQDELKQLNFPLWFAGGFPLHVSRSCRFFDPKTNSFITANPLKVPRVWHHTVMLKNHVLVIGGNAGPPTCEIIDLKDVDP